MRDRQRKTIFSFVALLAVLLLITACTPDGPDADETNTDTDDISFEEVDWEYEPYASDVASSDCTSLETAELSNTEAMPNQALSVSFDCVIDAAELTVTVGGTEAEALQITPTMMGFAVPADLIEGSQTINLSGSPGSADLSVSVLPAAESPADPKAYLTETISYQEALLADVDDLVLKQHLTQLLDEAEAELMGLSEEEAQQAALLIIANEEALGLQQNGLCDIQKTDPENWWTCFSAEIRWLVVQATAAGVVALGGWLTFLDAPAKVKKVGFWVGVVGTVGTGLSMYRLYKETPKLLSHVIQVIAGNVLDISITKVTEVDSGAPFTISTDAEYITFSGASMGSDATSVSAFLTVINQARDLTARVNDAVGTDIEIYSTDETPQTENLPVDPEYVYLFLHEDTTDAISAAVDGMEMTLTSTSADPEPVSIVVLYDFPGVRTVETTIDVVVQPDAPCADVSTPPSITNVSGRCEGDDWLVDVSFTSDPDGPGIPKRTLAPGGEGDPGFAVERSYGDNWGIEAGVIMYPGEDPFLLTVDGTYTIEILTGFQVACADYEPDYQYRVKATDECGLESDYVTIPLP